MAGAFSISLNDRGTCKDGSKDGSQLIVTT